MNEKLKDQDVLLVKEKDSNDLKVVKGVNSKSGKLETVSPVSENEQDFMKIDRHGNMLENFMENFFRQFKDPTHFLFFKAPADRVEEVAKNLQEALKNPETPVNKAFLDMHKVEPQVQKEYAINPDFVDWHKFERYGITREALEKSGNLDKLLDYQKTGLMTVAIKFDEETLRTDARFSLRKQDDGTFSPAIHLIRHQPELERPYFGVRFTEEDKKALLTTGNLGRVVLAEFRPEEKTPILLSLDKLTNELVAFRKEWMKIPETYKGVELNEEQKQKLGNGEKVEIRGMTSTQGKSFDGAVQFNADKRYFELIFDENKKQSQNRKQNREQDTGQNENKSIRISKNLMGVELSEKQQNLLKAGKTIYVSGMKDREGQDFNAYIKVNTEKNKLDFFKYNPDKKNKQNEEITPDEKHKTQVAKNNDGRTTEANKKVKEPLKSGQTQPDENQSQKQRKKTGHKVS